MPQTNPWKLAADESENSSGQQGAQNLVQDTSGTVPPIPLEQSPAIKQEESASLLGADDALPQPSSPLSYENLETSPENIAIPPQETLSQKEEKLEFSPSLSFVSDSSAPVGGDPIFQESQPVVSIFPEDSASAVEQAISLELGREKVGEIQHEEHENTPPASQHKKIAIAMASIGGLLFMMGILPFVTDSSLRAEIFGAGSDSPADALISSAVDVQVTPLVSSTLEASKSTDIEVLPSVSSTVEDEIHALLQTPSVPVATPLPAAPLATPVASTVIPEQNRNVGLSDPTGKAFAIPEDIKTQTLHSAPTSPAKSAAKAASASNGKIPPKNSGTGPEDFFILVFLSVFAAFLYRARSLFRGIS